jgi:hypothetical protein
MEIVRRPLASVERSLLAKRRPSVLRFNARRQASQELLEGAAEVVAGSIVKGLDLSGCDSAGCCRRWFLLNFDSGEYLMLLSADLPNSLGAIARSQLSAARGPSTHKLLGVEWYGEPIPVASWESADLSSLPVEFFPQAECEIIQAGGLPAEVRKLIDAA